MGILETIVPLFGIVIIGWILRRTDVMSKQGFKTLNNYTYYIGFPILVFVSLYNINFSTILDYKLYLVNLVSIFLVTGVAYAISTGLKFENKMKAAFILCALFGNVAYIGFPLTRLALGEAAMPFASIIAAIYIVLTFTLGLIVLEHYSSVKFKSKFWIFKVPLIWGVIFGLLFSYTGAPLPFSNLFTMVAASASPVALVAIGAFLHDTKFTKHIRKIALLGSLKLILFPLIVLLVSWGIGFQNLAFKSSMLQASTPVAITTFVLAYQFRAKSDFIASAIVTTTLASIVTLSFMLYFFV